MSNEDLITGTINLSDDAIECIKLEGKVEGLPKLTKEQEEALVQADNNKLKCSSCTFWRWVFKSVGECRRHPPIRDGLNSAKYPYTNILNWCGEHQLGENLI